MDISAIIQKIIELLFSEELTVPQIQLRLNVNFGIKITQNRIIQIVKQNSNKFAVIPEGKKSKISLVPQGGNPLKIRKTK